MAKYAGSAATGLGFYHFELPEVVVNLVASTKNCGVVIVAGELSLEMSLLLNFPRFTRQTGLGRSGN
jgi:hypothetical protein